MRVPAVGEQHPIADAPNWPVERRIHHLEVHLAQLWDQVWWLSLPPEKRDEYQKQGFRQPIENFYPEEDKATPPA